MKLDDKPCDCGHVSQAVDEAMEICRIMLDQRCPSYSLFVNDVVQHILGNIMKRTMFRMMVENPEVTLPLDEIDKLTYAVTVKGIHDMSQRVEQLISGEARERLSEFVDNMLQSARVITHEKRTVQ